ncbi:uncharacterized protein LOC142351942 [Convolutriloba macropyga]|uniref:uncharacterized protein LOC142351942 n=1 Tax=Convolutriloba macropyga TaxID=536237 RepID=UPI003F51F12D
MEQMTFTKVVIDGSCEKGSIIRGIPKWAADRDIARAGCQIKPRTSTFYSHGNSRKNSSFNRRNRISQYSQQQTQNHQQPQGNQAEQSSNQNQRTIGSIHPMVNYSSKPHLGPSHLDLQKRLHLLSPRKMPREKTKESITLKNNNKDLTNKLHQDRPETCSIAWRAKYNPTPRHNMFIICKPILQLKPTSARGLTSKSGGTANQKTFSQSQPAISSTNQNRQTRQLRSMPTMDSIRPPPCTPDLEASTREFNHFVNSLEKGERSGNILKNFVEVRKDTHSIYIQRTNTFG